MRDVIINADDFGLNRAVNRAVVEAHRNGILNSTSIMANGEAAEEALALAGENPGLKIGVHLSLVKEGDLRAMAEGVPLLTDGEGRLRHGFVSLLAAGAKHGAELERQLETEARTQVERVLAAGVKVTHLDSHRHVHAIPVLWRVVCRVAGEYGISRIRVVNERLVPTLRGGGEWRGLFDGGLVKNLVLRTLFLWNGARSDVYFYSLFHTMRLFGPNMRGIRVPAGFGGLEIGIHPAAPGESETVARERALEYETLLDKTLADRIVWGGKK